MAEREDSEEKRAIQAERAIKKKFNIYMSQTSKYNPFGPNSLASTYEQKRVFKYNLIKEYVKLTKKDQLYKEYQQSRFLGTMILGFVGGYFAAVAFSAIISKGRSWKMDQPGKFDAILYAFLMTSGFGYQYIASHQRYNKNVCNYILEKYLPQAIENGFQDYEISK